MSIPGLTKSTKRPAPAVAKPSINWNAETSKLTINFLGKPAFSAVVHVTDESGAQVPEAAPQASWEEQSRPAQAVYLDYDHGPKYAGDVPEWMQATTWAITLSPPQPGQQITLEGTVRGAEVFACRTDGAQGIIRNSLGNSTSMLNNGVYERAGDWAISVAEPEICSVRFRKSTTLGAEFAVDTSGPRVKLLFQPDFYRIHRGYFYWNPAKKVWKAPVAGWCSWEAYGQAVTEEQVIKAADFLAKELLPYGYDIVQIDDGYQRFNPSDPKPLEPGETVADFWVNANERFPNGMAELAKRIKAKHLVPGIWVSTSLPLGMRKEWYVLGEDDQPFRARWANYAVNGCLEPAVEHAFRRTIRALRMQGWKYFKIDTIRHVLYDSYRQVPEYWRKRGENSDTAFRVLFEGIAEEIGPTVYMLACWGVIPELCDIADGCRIGGDVSASWDSALMVQEYTCRFNFLNNIIWRNDPDYMCFRVPIEQARSWATMVALTGMQMMVSDPPATYNETRLDILRKVGPPLSVRPTTLAPMEPGAEFWLLEIESPPEPYVVLGRIAWTKKGLPRRKTPFADFGLDPARRYLVFDFWNEKFIGEFEEEFPSEHIEEGDCRVYAIRPALERPQVLSTNRHIGQGAYELENVAWRNNTLSGRMKLPPGRPFSIFIHVPRDYKPTAALPADAIVQQDKHILGITLSSEPGGMVEWSVQFEAGAR